MTEQIASVSDTIDLCYETYGNEDDPAVLLIMGLGGPMGWWNPAFCELLADRGYFVIRYDNRDTGASTRVRGRKVSRLDVVRAYAGDRSRAIYTISDLAADAVGLLDHLGIDRAHLVGVSMGGMIAQTVAIEHRERVLSLTSIMSTTGRRTVGWQNPKLVPALLAPAGNTRDDYIKRSLRTQKMIGSPGFTHDPDEQHRRAGETYDRGWSAGGVLRQMLAILTQPDRTRALRRLDLATCVIHGIDDPLVHPSGGRATAAAIPGAELVLIPGMAHDLPRDLDDILVDAIVRTARRGARREGSSGSVRSERSAQAGLSVDDTSDTSSESSSPR